MNQKAQVTLFLLVSAIFILAVVMLFADSESLSSDVSSSDVLVQTVVEACLKQTGENGLSFVLLQGGFYEVPEPYEPYYQINLPYYWDNGLRNMPTLEGIQEHFSSYVEDNLLTCIDKFSKLEQLGYEILGGNPEVETVFGEENVLIELDYPLTIRLQETTSELASFSSEILFPMRTVKRIVDSYMDAQMDDWAGVPIGELSRLSLEHGFEYELVSLSGDRMITSLVFNYTGTPVIFGFISQFETVQRLPSSFVYIEPIPDMVLTESEIVEYQVVAEGEELTFSDNTDLFDIHPKTGVIQFDPYLFSNQEQNVLITATDMFGESAAEFVTVVVDFSSETPTITSIPPQQAKVGEVFRYTVESSSSDTLFSDSTDLFDIHPITGIIQFVPEQTGEYYIEISAASSGGSTQTYMSLTIT